MSHFTELLPDPLPAEPLTAVSEWLAESIQRRLQPNPNAMVLATVGSDGQPSARVVLCKDVVPVPGYLVFYTNYLSRKGRQLAENPRAAVVIHWDALHRQIRVEGPVVKGPDTDSDAYFASRAWQSRLGAWASAQSEPLASRQELQRKVADMARRFGTPPPDKVTDASADFPVPRPPHWGGYRLWAESVELWVEGDSRIHDRARWTRSVSQPSGAGKDGAMIVGPWAATRLQP